MIFRLCKMFPEGTSHVILIRQIRFIIIVFCHRKHGNAVWEKLYFLKLYFYCYTFLYLNVAYMNFWLILVFAKAVHSKENHSCFYGEPYMQTWNEEPLRFLSMCLLFFLLEYQSLDWKKLAKFGNPTVAHLKFTGFFFLYFCYMSFSLV